MLVWVIMYIGREANPMRDYHTSLRREMMVAWMK